jgi:hypothetical protein
MAVSCANVGQQGLKRPPKSEKKRGGWRSEWRGESLSKSHREERAREERDRASKRMIMIRWDTGRRGRAGLCAPPPPMGKSAVDRGAGQGSNG